MTKRYSKYKSLIFEELEPRLLFSADGAEVFAGDALEQTLEEQPIIIIEQGTQEQEDQVSAENPVAEPVENNLSGSTAESGAEESDDSQSSPEELQFEIEAGSEQEQLTAPDETTVSITAATPATEETALEINEISSTTELVFVNDNVLDGEKLIDDIRTNDESNRSFQVVTLDSTTSGLDQISETLNSYDDLDAIHIITHGREGAIALGSDWLDNDNLLTEQDAISGWGDALNETGDILFYGCNIAAGSDGQSLLDSIATLTEGDVAASNDLTGSAGLGGDWDLEVHIGEIETVVAPSQAAQESWAGLLDITNGLVGHWTFDADATDLSGNGYNGTLTNGALIDTTSGTNKIGDGKLSLDGNNDYVDLSAHVANFQNLSEGTIAVWVNAAAASRDVIFEMSDSGDSDSRLALLRDSDGSLDFYIREGNTTLLDAYTGADAIPLDTWTHIAVTVDSSGNKLYVNGVQQGSLTYDAGSSTTDLFLDDVADLDFASWGVDKYDGASFVRYFDGLLDDGRLYDRALSSSDIAELYNYTGLTINTTSFQQGNGNGYNSTVDTFLNEGFVTQDNSTSVDIQVDLDDGAGDETTQGLIRFDDIFGTGTGQVPYNVLITSATLTVNVNNVSDTGAVISMHEMLINWTDTDTWSSTGGILIDDVEAAITADSILSAPAALGSVTFTGLEDRIQAWLDGASTNFGWLISSDSDNGWDFDSSESGNQPILAISYVLPGSQSSTAHNLVVDTVDDVMDGDTTSIDTLLADKGADGLISLREAIWAANNTTNFDSSTPDVINFAIGSGAQTIMVAAGGLPTLTDAVILDATSQPSYASTPLIALDGTNAFGSTGGIVLRTSNSIVRGFIVHDFPDEGIEIDGSTGFGDDNIIENNWVGLNPAGWGVGNDDNGILISEDADGNTVRNNIVGANAGDGILIRNNSDGNWVWGNTVGLSTTGTAYRANSGNGISISGTSIGNIIGTDNDSTNDAAERNLISGNSQAGVRIEADANIVAGNYIGTDVTGTLDRGNSGDGIYANGATNLTITGNVISGNTDNGISFNNVTNSTIDGNYIGTDSTGTFDLGNALKGIQLQDSSGNLIGGSTVADRNVISGNDNDGIILWGSGSTLNVIRGNYIGVDVTGDSGLGNSADGINISGGASNNTIGGDQTSGEGNVISGQIGAVSDGIEIDNTGADDNKIYGNYIGTNYDGTSAIANARHGIVIYDGVQGTEVGGAGTGQGNIISGNTGSGIVIDGNGKITTTGNVIEGNYIGVDVTGISALGNSNQGVEIFGSASGNLIGGESVGAGNIIAFNSQYGINLVNGTNNAIVRNSIHSNTLLGINLGSGANNDQSFPVLTSAITNGTQITVEGTLNSFANTTFRIEIYSNATGDPSGYGEGQTLIGILDVGTDGFGNASFSSILSASVPAGSAISATVSRLDMGDAEIETSEFAQNVIATAAANSAPLLDNSGFLTLTTITEDNTGNSGNLVSEIIASDGGDRITDVDVGALEGIAITGLTNGNGSWEYNIGSGWNAIGAVSDTSAFLLRATDSVRFVPDGLNSDLGIILFSAWDQTSGTAGTIGDRTSTGGSTAFSSQVETAVISVTAVNDAPSLSTSSPFPSILEDDFNNSGMLVSTYANLSSDVDAGALKGIAITSLDNSNGNWQYTLDGSNWSDIGSVSTSSALLLPSDAASRFRFVPNPDYNGSSGILNYKAWDQTTGTAGSYVDVTTSGGTTAFSNGTNGAALSVDPVNDAPVIEHNAGLHLTTILEDPTVNNGDLISAILSSSTDGPDSVSDVDSGAVEGIAIFSLSNSNGTWEYDTGSGWTAVGSVSIGSSLLLRDTDSLRFVPNPEWNGTELFTFAAWDQTSGAAGTKVDTSIFGGTSAFSTGTAIPSITVNGVNDGLTISVTNSTPTFTENGGPVSLFSGTSIDPIESDLIDTLQLTVDALADGSNEILVVDGQAVELTHLNSETTATNSYDVDISVSGTTATVVISRLGGFSALAAETLIDGLAYDNTSENPQGAVRLANLISIKDDGGTTGGGVDTEGIGISSLVTISAINDDPTNSGSLPTDVTVTEDVTGSVDLSTLNISDVDAGNNLITVTLTTSTGGRIWASSDFDVTVFGSGTGTLILNGGVADLNSFFSSSSRFQYLHSIPNTNGDNADTIQVEINDGGNTGTGGGGTIVLGTVNVDISPVNDAPVNTVPGTQTVDEEIPTVIAGISISDVDAASADLTTKVAVTNGVLDVTLAGSATISAGSNGTNDLTILGTIADINTTLSSLTYTGNTDVTGIAADSLTVITNDGGNTGSGGAHQVINFVQIDIAPLNDPPVIGGVDTGSVTEDVDPDTNNLLEVSAALTIVDPDAGESSFVAETITGTYGQLIIDALGNWDYSAVNTQAAIQQLDAGQSVTDTLTVTTADGTTHDVVITINGAEDAPVLGGIATGSVTEDTTLSDTGTLTITDVDSSDNPISFVDEGPVAGTNGYGTFQITGNTWTYTLNNGLAAVQALDSGETLSDTYTFTATDGSAQLVSVTINGNEDAPVLGGVATGSVIEDTTLSDTDTLTITDVDSSDNPISFVDEGPVAGTNGYGTFQITGNTWTYTLNNGLAAVQALDSGETLGDTYTFTATDGSTQLVTVTINGNEDAPVLGGVATGTVTEDTTLSDTDTLTITDVDSSDNPVSFIDEGPVAGTNGYGTFQIAGNTWTYTLNNGLAAVQALDAGETLSDTYTFTATDGSTQLVSVTINGNEDSPVLGGVATGSVTEDTTLSDTDTLTITDVDTSDNPISFVDEGPVVGTNGYGIFQINGNTWTYTLNNGLAAVQALDAGETLNDTYTFTATDGSTQLVSVTINGNEDAPVLGGVATGSVTEDTTLSDTDTLTITDVDTSDNPISFVDEGPVVGTNGYGTFQITGNTWTYTLNNGLAAVQALDAGEALNDTYTFTATDGSTQLVSVTINGNEDAPVIGGVAIGSVTEDTTLTDSDTLTITDVDNSDNPISFIDEGPVAGTNGYGTFQITGNTWTYTLNNGLAAVQALDSGETLGDTYTFTATDGSTQLVSVTINGNEDAPVLGGVATGSVTEDISLTDTDTLTITDVDTSDNPINFVDEGPIVGVNGYGTFQITGNTWTYTLNNGLAAVQELDAGETLNDTYTFTATDGSTQLVSVTINGNEDAPVLGGVATGSVTEDTTLSDSDTLTITDVDNSDNPISFVDEGPVAGTNGYGTFQITGNTWTYTLNNGLAAVQALDSGETLGDTYTFTATDGSTQLVSVIINGNEDAPVLGGVATGSVTEDTTLSDTDTLTIIDVDASDNPISFVDEGPVAGTNGYGTFQIAGNTWTYTLNNGLAAVQALDSGETLSDSYTFTATDGSTQLVSLTINGNEDAPVLGGVATGSVTEDTSLTDTDTLTITDVDTSDNPINFVDEGPIVGVNGYGTFQITGNAWTYTLNNGLAAVQALDAGETLNDTYTFTATDGSTQLVSVTINGNEDAPVLGGVATGSVTEDTVLSDTDPLTITDVDTSDNPISFADEGPVAGTNGYGTFQITGNTWTYTLNNGLAAVQALDAGETLNDSYTFTATDGSTQLVSVTINGNEDAPVLGGVATGSVIEDTTLSDTDTLTITDVDTSDNPISFVDEGPVVGTNGYGTFQITGNTWTYTLNNGLAAVQALDAGEALNDTYTFTATDGSTQLVSVTINGNEDAPVIGGVAIGSVTEDTTLTDSDTLTITDIDTSDNPISFVDEGPVAGANGYGTFQITGNTWTYTLNNGLAAVQALDTGETLNDTYTFTANDGSTQLVSVTINGNEDAPVLGGVTTGSVTEDTILSNSDTLTITDVDTSDNPISFVDEGPVAGTNGYGTFQITGNTWTYTLNNGLAAVQALDAGETLNDTYTFTASDGSTQLVSVIINGNEDASTLDNPIADQTATEDIPFSFTFAADTFGDVDTSDILTYIATLDDDSALPVWLNFDDATRTFSGTPTNADVGTINVKVTAGDGTSTVLDIFALTVNNTGDPPVIGGVDTGSVTEDVDPDTNNLLEVSDALTIVDPDAGESGFVAEIIVGTYGQLIIDALGSWDYSADNTQAAIQQLDAGQSVTDTLTVTTADGTTHNIVITINGAEDAPVLGGIATGTVTEDTTLSDTDTLVITDVDTSDNPISFVDEGPIAGTNGYGTFQITGNTWTYTLNNGLAAVQALDVGETLNDTYTFTATDGSAQLVSITINGNEDTPVLGGVATGSVTEDTALSDSDSLTITDVDTNDNPISFVDEGPVVGVNGYGTFQITGNTWTYTLNNGLAAVQALDTGETLNDTYTFTATDGSTQLVSVTINGNEDAPVLGGVATGSVTEDTTLSDTDTLSITDVDTSDNPISFVDEGPVAGTNGYGTFQITGNTWTYTLNNGLAAVQALDSGETLNDTYTFTATDGSTQLVAVTINGNEDAPVLGGVATGSVTEDTTLSDTDTLSITDIDTSDNPISFVDEGPVVGANGYGTFQITGNTWTYTLNNGLAAVQELDAGETLNDTYTFTATDGSTQLVSVTINGNEDAPVLGGVATGSVTEDTVLSDTDTLTITDVDTSDNPISFVDEGLVAGTNGYGSFQITGNAWTYTLNNGLAAVQALDAGETLNDTYTFTATDGSTQLVSVTINGNEDAPVLGGVATGSVTEETTLSDTDTLTITDVDTSDNPISFVDEGPVAGANGYGIFQITGNTWTYTLNNGLAAVQALDTGETLNDTYTFTATDGSTQLVSVTINGNEDAPVLGGVVTGSVTEDTTLSDSELLTITDADTNDNPISFVDEGPVVGTNGYGTFQITGNTWTYTLNNGLAAVQALDAGETLNDSYTFTATDGSTQLVSVTIDGNEDAPVLGGVATGSVTEDTTISDTDILFITDVDTNDNPISFVDEGPVVGSNGYGSFQISGNTWTYTLNNGLAAIQALDSGETLSDTYTFTATDGSTQLVSVTINGNEDAPVLGGVATGSVTEDTTLSDTDTLTITDVDTSDNPISFVDEGPVAGTNGYGTFQIIGNIWTYTLNNGLDAVQALDAGETLNDTYNFTATDGSTQLVSVTINGNEDAPVLGGVATGSVTEDTTLSDTNTLTITDVDTSDNPISFVDEGPVAGANGYGTFQITGNTWTYTLNNGLAAVQALDSGEALSDTYTFTATDGSTQLVSVTINGNEDAPVLGGVATGTVTEDTTLSDTDTLTITDVDSSDNPVSFIDEGPVAGTNGYGTFQIAGNTWTYTLNNGLAAVQALDAGETLNDTYTFTATDGSTQLVSVTISGNEDAPVLGGVATGSVTEDTTLLDTDTLTITDVDASDNPISFVDEGPVAGTNGYGTFQITGNTWTYTLNNGLAAIQALDAGETLNDTYTFTATDGSTQLVSVTINGNEDAPVLGGVATGSVTEDTTLSDMDTLTITDVDTSDNPISFVDEGPVVGTNGYGTFQITGNTWTYTLNNGLAAVQSLNDGESLSDNYVFTATDGSTQLTTITINGSSELVVTPPDPDPEPDPDPDPIPEPDDDSGSTGTGDDPVADDPGPGEENPVDLIDESGTDDPDSTPVAEFDDQPAEGDPNIEPEPEEYQAIHIIDNSDVVDKLVETLSQEEATTDSAGQYLGYLAAEASGETGAAHEKSGEIRKEVIKHHYVNYHLQAIKATLTELSDFIISPASAASFYMGPVDLDAIAGNEVVRETLKEMQDDMDASYKESAAYQKTMVYAVSGVSASFAAGFVSYLLRAGSLMSSFLATVPVWSNFDPVAILVSPTKKEKKKKETDNTPPSELTAEQKAESMFVPEGK